MYLGPRESNITHNNVDKYKSEINFEIKLFSSSIRVDKAFADFDNNVDDDGDLNTVPIIAEEQFPNISKLELDVAKSKDSSDLVHPKIHQC